MSDRSSSVFSALESREDLLSFGSNALLLLALELQFGIEDIAIVASNSITDGPDDKKVDLVHIDAENQLAVVAQCYNKENPIGGESAPSNKASDLNTAITWLINSPIDTLPSRIRSHAKELRTEIEEGNITKLHIWYVHNLEESENVKKELGNVARTAKQAIESNFAGKAVNIEVLEVGRNRLEEWYKSILSPILVDEKYKIPINGGFSISGEDWEAYVTSIPAKILYEFFKNHNTALLSANVRDYLGSRKVDNNINNGIKLTAVEDPSHFWVFNNGITVLVHRFEEINENGEMFISIKGISVVNGAQTTGAIGTLDKPPSENVMVQVRFVRCDNQSTIQDIVRYNNSQNRITAPDFRSNDRIQKRIEEEFRNIPNVIYFPRRGGREDLIKRNPSALPSFVAGQALAAFHGNPDHAYHQKSRIWENDTLYQTYFNENTTANHITFAYSLLRAVEKKKKDLFDKSKDTALTEMESKQLEFFRKRGSTFLLVTAIAKCLETILEVSIPVMFRLGYKDKLSPDNGAKSWEPIIDVACSFTEPLNKALSDGIKNRSAVDTALLEFRGQINANFNALKSQDQTVYSEFKKLVEL